MEEYIDLVVPIKDLGFMITGILNNFESLLRNALTKLLLQRAFSFYIFLNGKDITFLGRLLQRKQIYKLLGG